MDHISKEEVRLLEVSCITGNEFIHVATHAASCAGKVTIDLWLARIHWNGLKLYLAKYNSRIQ
jgi:hypothetical protein